MLFRSVKPTGENPDPDEGYEALAETKEVPAEIYQVRVKGTDKNDPSVPAEITVAGWTGFGEGENADTYYKGGKTVNEAQWVGTDEKFYVDEDSTKVKNAWVPKDGRAEGSDEVVYVNENGKNATDFGIYGVTCPEKKGSDDAVEGYTLTGLNENLVYQVNGTGEWKGAEGEATTVDLLFADRKSVV